MTAAKQEMRPVVAPFAGSVLLAGYLALSALSSARYAGSGMVFALFTLCFLALAGLVLPKPRHYSYIFLAALLILGFWAKVVARTLWWTGFLEPVGDFASTPAEWDQALLAASCGALGVIAARCVHLWHAARRGTDNPDGGVPGWFLRHRRKVWLLTLVLVVAVNAANLQFAFYQVGVNPKLLLPMRMHVVLGWLVNVGFALWIAVLAWWDCRSRPAAGAKVLAAPMVEAACSSISAFSRLMYLLHAAPYWLAIYERRRQLAQVASYRSLSWLLGAFFVLFVVSVLAVFWLRVFLYYGYAEGKGGDEPLASHVQRTVEMQVPQLILRRWIGLEGVLTVGAVANRSLGLGAAAVADSPRLAERSLYQRTARVRYLSEHAQFTFLTNAGPVAILWFSGSLAVVLAGMAVVGLALVATEEAARRWTGNPFLCSVSGAALANVVAQTTFFYLTLVFLLQLWVAIAFLAAAQRLEFGNSLRG